MKQTKKHFENNSIGVDCSRRSFFKKSLGFSAALLCPLMAGDDDFPDSVKKFVREARYYEKLDHKKIKCKLCPRECVIDDRERGYCGVRENRGGAYYTLVYARPCTYHVDPIEKKPLFHFLPGTMAFSFATAGCNLNCKFCQNWQISQVTPEQVQSLHVTPEQIAAASVKYDCRSIAYTYSEPTVFYEYMEDTAEAGHESGIKSVVITAAYISQKPLINLCKKVDAIKVDLKAFSESYYKEVVNGELYPVLDSLITMKKEEVWTEIVYLVVPTMNDSDKEITGLCRWVLKYLGKDVPIHFTRFHPQYLLKDLPPTPIKTLERIKQIADSEGLHYVYIGNVPGHEAENTVCPSCQNPIIQRSGFIIRNMNIKDGKCNNCGQEIPGIWR